MLVQVRSVGGILTETALGRLSEGYARKHLKYIYTYIHAHTHVYRDSGNINVPLSKFGISYGNAVRMKTSRLCCSRRDVISVTMER
jgi:hypothetical protein